MEGMTQFDRPIGGIPAEGDPILTPLGEGEISTYNMMKDIYEVTTPEGILAVPEAWLRTPEIHLFPGDGADRILAWSRVRWVVEIITLVNTLPCRCECRGCVLMTSYGWALQQGNVFLIGATHNPRNNCLCQLSSCSCMVNRVELPTTAEILTILKERNLLWS